jgi:hypothetical protein
MKIHPLLWALTIVNFALLMLTFTQIHTAVAAEAVAPVLRGRALEIVDERGRARATIAVIPAGRSERGERSAETVLLRLITERGRPSVKVAASEESAGLSFAGPTGTERTWAQLLSQGKVSSLTLKNEDGGEKVVRPD